MAKRGVVTLCDSNYFPGLLQLHASIQSSWPCPVVSYDIGLTPNQRSQADSLPGLTILDLPDDPLIAEIQKATQNRAPLAKASKRIWPLWICPLLIRAAPFDEVFWLDCDLIVLRGLDELFSRLEDGPVFTPENKAPEMTPNAPELYNLLPIHRPFERHLPVVNGGVSGWRRGRDESALAAYIFPIEAAARDESVMDAISWHDQGALIWAIQSLGLQSRVIESPLWNLCVDHVRLPKGVNGWDVEFNDRLREALPEVRLLHWNGSKPFWINSSQGNLQPTQSICFDTLA